MIDVPRLLKALEHITAHPEEWDQKYWVTTAYRMADGNVLRGDLARSYWLENPTAMAEATACGTTCCLAGTVVMQAGSQLSQPRLFHNYDVVLDGEKVGVMDAAADLLGLTLGEARDLFQDSNSLSQLWHKAWRLTGGEIEIPLQFQGAW